MMLAHTFSVYDLIKRNAMLFPDATALVDGEKSLTFKDFFIHVNSLASGLSLYGIKPRQSVAVLSMNRLEYLVLYGAVSAIGAILVPLNWRLSSDELAYILKDSGSKLLFFNSTQKEQAFTLKESSGFNGQLACFDEQNLMALSQDSGMAASQNSAMAVQDSGMTVSKNTNIDADSDIDTLSYVEMTRQGAASALEFTPFMLQPNDIFALIYTAAIAGKPRGAALSHSNIIASNLQTSLTMNLGSQDVYLNMLPLFHITGMNLSLAVMHMGGKNIIMEKFNASEALSNIQKEKVSLMASFPPILTALMDEMDKKNITDIKKSDNINTSDNINKDDINQNDNINQDDSINKDNNINPFVYDLSSLKNTVGIDSPETIRKFTEKTASRFWVLYGQSETSGFVTLSDSSECTGSAGRQCCISHVAIVDENDVVLPSGQSGEIAVCSPVVFQGFWRGSCDESDSDSAVQNRENTLIQRSEGNTIIKHDDALIVKHYNTSTVASYDTSTIRNGWHHTGDIGHIDSNGYLWFEGRKSCDN
ncbi:MAG: AMP-binding protein [Desulfamplus sp.]|nr:AMP-binding protein [Desulfamplus sp.]